MSTSFPGFPDPAASTEVPLEMLASCHLRIQKMCATLGRLAAYLPAHGSDDQARQAAARIKRYFDTAAPLHHADEEADLFPALLESMAGSDAVCIREMIEHLTSQHRILEAAWARLRDPLELIAAGQSATLPPDGVALFTETYEQHLNYEEDELLPMAARLLAQADLTRIGLAMRARRGLEAAD
ncbi:MAG TPA: hemerythrin domain-containing protein [Candidimonas sp.]|nr:hemerythrin domain-containing protein [Candidimonas sp.]